MYWLEYYYDDDYDDDDNDNLASESSTDYVDNLVNTIKELTVDDTNEEYNTQVEEVKSCIPN